MPFEVIVIDNADDENTRNLLCSKEYSFKRLNIKLKYTNNGNANSLTIAKNIGVKYSIGDYLLFLDDDVILDPDFIKNILFVFKQNSNAIGVQGYITNTNFNPIYNIVFKLFYLSYSINDKNKLLPSIRNVHASPLSKIINCEWLMGGCTCYHKKVFETMQFDENLKKYCTGEDVDFSYRVSKKYPFGLFQTPFAKLIHKGSPTGRAPKKESTFMGQVYHTYLFYKLMDMSLENILVFLWSRLGYLVVKFAKFIIKPSKYNLLDLLYLIQSYIYCMSNYRDIINGNISLDNIIF